MQTYQDMGDNYEPSADELIDVLKNLENLAAINPALYRAIVDQIKSKITYRKKNCFDIILKLGLIMSYLFFQVD